MGKKRDLSEILSEKELKKIRDDEKLEDLLRIHNLHFNKILAVAERLTKEQVKRKKMGLDEKPETTFKELKELKQYPYAKRLNIDVEIADHLIKQGELMKGAKYYADAAIVARKMRKKEEMKKYSDIVMNLLKQAE